MMTMMMMMTIARSAKNATAIKALAMGEKGVIQVALAPVEEATTMMMMIK
jgi:hypothetical protein